MSYSHLETFPAKPPGRDYLYQPFTVEQWQKSSFASERELAWFKDARYGMFIHFGLSSYKKADLSWDVCYTRKAPDFGHGPYADDEWKQWAEELQFENFDADRWIAIAKQAGFKYVVVITKHHDGFHMWDTAESEFKITNTPFGRDLVKEIVDACHRHKMPVGLYYSQRDWQHADYMPVDPEKIATQTSTSWTLKPGVDSPIGDRHWKYLQYQEKAVRELCTRYGKIDVFWWDALWWGGMFTADMWDSERINRIIRALQPGIIINNRCSIPGDFDTPEKRLGRFQNWRPWESCVCLSDTWSYSGTPVKSLNDLVGMLTMAICGDGNLLISWGPQWSGRFDDVEVTALAEMGEWIKSHEQAIFATRGGPWKPGVWGGSVYRGSTVYLHIVNLAGETLELPELPGCAVLSASLFGADTRVEIQHMDNTLNLRIPADMKIGPSTVVKLELSRDAATIEPIDSCAPSPFMDICAYGYEYKGDLTVSASPIDEEKQSGGSRPWIKLDFGKAINLTAVVLELAATTRAQDIYLYTSRDGETWTDWGKVDGDRKEIEITSYQAGAWIPGHMARYVKLQSRSGQAASVKLLSFRCFSR